MKQIENISLERMNNGAHFLFISNVLTRANADEKVKTTVKALLANLDAACKAEDEALKTSQKSLLTDDIVVADHLRDTLYRAYRKAVGSFKNFPAEAMAQAYRELWQHIKDYNIDPAAQLDKETGLLVNFIGDLEGKYATQVTTLGLTVFVTQLRAANQRVIDLTASRTDERIPVIVGSMKSARTASDAAYHEFVRMVNALALVQGEADYADFIDYLNTEIVHYKREVIGQKANKPTTGGGSDNGDGGETPDPDSGDDEAPDPTV